MINFRLFCSNDCRSWPREEKFWSDDCRSRPREEKINNHGCWGKHAHIPDNDYWGIWLFHVVWTNFILQLFLCGTHGIYIFFLFINWTLRMSDNLPERVQILGHAHIICITVREDRNILRFALKICFWADFNVMQKIFIKIKWHIKVKIFNPKIPRFCLSYYFKGLLLIWFQKSNRRTGAEFSKLYFWSSGLQFDQIFLWFELTEC